MSGRARSNRQKLRSCRLSSTVLVMRNKKRGRTSALFSAQKAHFRREPYLSSRERLKERPRTAAFARAGEERRGQTAARLKDASLIARPKDSRAPRPPPDRGRQ